LKRTGEKKARYCLRAVSRVRHKRLIQYLVALAALAQVQVAMGVTVRAQLERSRVELGDSVGLQISVVDSPGGPISAQMPRIAGLEVRRSGSVQQTINLRRTDILNYVITPSREGTFVIPPISVQVAGQTLRTNRQNLSVSKVPQDARMRLTVSVSKRECYVLQSIDVTFKWYISSDARRYELNIPLLNDKDNLSLKMIPPSSAGKRKIVANRYELSAGSSSEKLDGTEYTVFSLSFRIFPPEPGLYTVRPGTVRAYVQSGYKMETDLFGSRRRAPNYERIFAASDPINLVVEEPPAEGKPAGFTGAIGKYSISAGTDDTRVKVGDPILLKVSISGDGLLERIKRPRLSEDPAFAGDFLISESLAPGDVSGNNITFEQTVRAKSEKVKEIPSVALAYFDPDKEAYDIARSRPIPITVLPTTEVTAEDVVKFGSGISPGATTRPEELAGGILANYNHLEALRNQAVKWSLLSFLGLPPAAYLIVLVVVGRRRKLAGNVALARSRSARKVLMRYLAEARGYLRGEDRRFYDSVARGIGQFTSDRLNLGTGELTAYDVEALAEQGKIKMEISEKISELLTQCDAGRFTPSSQSVEDRRELLRRAEGLAKLLERTL